MQTNTWGSQSLFYFSKRVAWRWRWTLALILGATGLYFYDADAGIIVWSTLAMAAFLVVLGLMIFINSSKLVSVNSGGISFYDSAFKDGQMLLGWNLIESISTRKDEQEAEVDENQHDISNPVEEPWSLYFKLNDNPFPKDFFPSHFLWDENTLVLELNTAPKQGFAPLLKIIHQYRPKILRLHGFSLNTIEADNLFSMLFAFCYDLSLIVTIIAGFLIASFYQAFESGDALERLQRMDKAELLRLQQEVRRRFLGEEMDFSIKEIPPESYYPTKRTASEHQAEPYRFPDGIIKELVFESHFKNPPHTGTVWQPGLFSLNAQFSWSNEAAYDDGYSLKIKMQKKKIGEPDANISAWNSSLRHHPGEGYLLEAYVLSPDNARSSLAIETFDAEGSLTFAFSSICSRLESKDLWFFTQHKVEAEKIPPSTRSVRFALQQCVGEDDVNPGTLYYDAVKVYALKKSGN